MILLWTIWTWRKDCRKYGGDDKLAVPLRERLRTYVLCFLLPSIMGILMANGGAE